MHVTLVREAVERWELYDLEPAPHHSYNYVAFARRHASDVVLKIGKDLAREIAALRLMHNHGVVRILEADEENGMLLLERLKPGYMLSTLRNDEEATHIAVEVILKLRGPIPVDSRPFSFLSDWFDCFEKLRRHFDGTTGPLDRRLVERAEGISKDLLAENHAPMLIHGDLHHFNILSSERGWIAIDPKGVIGPSAYEVGPFLLNPRDKTPEELARRLERRIAILSEGLGIEKERIRRWAIAHAVLSACWGIEDNTGWEHAMACAKIFS